MAFILIRLAFTLAAAALLAGAVADVLSTRAFLASAQRADATVVDLHESDAVSSNQKSTTKRKVYTPVFEFRTPDDRRHAVSSSVAYGEGVYSIGEQVGVFYDPLTPSEAKIDGFASLWFVPLLLTVFGLVLSAVAAVMWRRPWDTGQPVKATGPGTTTPGARRGRPPRP